MPPPTMLYAPMTTLSFPPPTTALTQLQPTATYDPEAEGDTLVTPSSAADEDPPAVSSHLRSLAEAEPAAAAAAEEKVRFRLQELHRPPALRGWITSHQDEKYASSARGRRAPEWPTRLNELVDDAVSRAGQEHSPEDFGPLRSALEAGDSGEEFVHAGVDSPEADSGGKRKAEGGESDEDLRRSAEEGERAVKLYELTQAVPSSILVNS